MWVSFSGWPIHPSGGWEPAGNFDSGRLLFQISTSDNSHQEGKDACFSNLVYSRAGEHLWVPVGNSTELWMDHRRKSPLINLWIWDSLLWAGLKLFGTKNFCLTTGIYSPIKTIFMFGTICLYHTSFYWFILYKRCTSEGLWFSLSLLAAAVVFFHWCIFLIFFYI